MSTGNRDNYFKLKVLTYTKKVVQYQEGVKLWMRPWQLPRRKEPPSSKVPAVGDECRCNKPAFREGVRNGKRLSYYHRLST